MRAEVEIRLLKECGQQGRGEWWWHGHLEGHGVAELVIQLARQVRVAKRRRYGIVEAAAPHIPPLSGPRSLRKSHTGGSCAWAPCWRGGGTGTRPMAGQPACKPPSDHQHAIAGVCMWVTHVGVCKCMGCQLSSASCWSTMLDSWAAGSAIAHMRPPRAHARDLSFDLKHRSPLILNRQQAAGLGLLHGKHRHIPPGTLLPHLQAFEFQAHCRHSRNHHQHLEAGEGRAGLLPPPIRAGNNVHILGPRISAHTPDQKSKQIDTCSVV